MNATTYVVPDIIRGDGNKFDLRESPTSRRPAAVSPGAFRARGLAVPEDPRQWNHYQLTERQGAPWSPGIDRWIAAQGGELLTADLILADVDIRRAVDGSALLDSFRWLADRATEVGEVLDIATALTVRTPGHPENGHLPGWHLWYRLDSEHPVRTGPLERCRDIELKRRGTCPGSPGYEIRHIPDEIPVLPQWLAALAGKPRIIQARAGRTFGQVSGRLEGIIDSLLEAGPGDHRRNLLFWAARRCREMIAAGELDTGVATSSLYVAAEDNGLVAKRGEADVRRTIADGLRGAA